jgi:RHS repeat-associated protein
MASANVYRFSSKEFHANSGLYYYGYRFYDPNCERWTNRDPLLERGGLNLYGFAHNASVNNLDPNGELSMSEIIVIATSVYVWYYNCSHLDKPISWAKPPIDEVQKQAEKAGKASKNPFPPNPSPDPKDTEPPEIHGPARSTLPGWMRFPGEIMPMIILRPWWWDLRIQPGGPVEA